MSVDMSVLEGDRRYRPWVLHIVAGWLTFNLMRPNYVIFLCSKVEPFQVQGTNNSEHGANTP